MNTTKCENISQHEIILSMRLIGRLRFPLWARLAEFVSKVCKEMMRLWS